MILKSIVVFLIILLIPVVLAVGAFVQNRLPWSDPPGFSKRLHTYLTSNRAVTGNEPEFPELTSRFYPELPEKMTVVVKRAMLSLGWEILVSNRQGQVIQGVITTPLLRFRDDVVVMLRPDETKGRTGVDVQARSRTGRGDFGTNTRHILDLYAAIENELRYGPEQ